MPVGPDNGQLGGKLWCNAMCMEFWVYKGEPREIGWYAALVCYDELEGAFPCAAYWDGSAWKQKAVVAFGERCDTEGAAERIAYENDADALNASEQPRETSKDMQSEWRNNNTRHVEWPDALVRDVVAILRSRGIEATPQQVTEWADLMVRRFGELRGDETDAKQWLHLHFGDAR